MADTKNTEKTRPGIVLYFEITPVIEQLEPADAKQLILAALRYGEYGEIPELGYSVGLIWPLLKSAIDRDAAAYREKQIQAIYKVYCRETKKKDETPMSYEDWKAAVGLSEDYNRYLLLSNDKNTDLIYPSTSTSTPPAPPISSPLPPSPSTTTQSVSAGNEHSGKEEVWRGKTNELYFEDMRKNGINRLEDHLRSGL